MSVGRHTPGPSNSSTELPAETTRRSTHEAVMTLSPGRIRAKYIVSTATDPSVVTRAPYRPGTRLAGVRYSRADPASAARW